MERLEHARMWRLILVQPFQYSSTLLWSLMEQRYSKGNVTVIKQQAERLNDTNEDRLNYRQLLVLCIRDVWTIVDRTATMYTNYHHRDRAD